MTYEERRKEVYQIITKRGGLIGTHWAQISRAPEAYKLAKQDPPLPDPWPQLAAYRFARTILKKAVNEIEKLKKAALLMKEASEAKSIGPLPLIYRAAILHRISSSLQNNSEEQKKYSRLAKQSFRIAIERTQAWYLSLYEEKGGDFDNEDYVAPVSGFYNMLELIAILSRSEEKLYEILPESNLFAWQNFYDDEIFDERAPSRWLIAGHDAGLMSVMIPRETAFEELNSRAQTKPNALFFRLSDNKNPVRMPICEYRLGDDTRWQQGSYGPILLLAYCLAGTMSDFGTMQKEIYRRREKKQSDAGEVTDAINNHFRQQKNRLKELLKELELTKGIEDRDIFFKDPQKKILRLNPRIEVYGAIDGDMLFRW